MASPRLSVVPTAEKLHVFVTALQDGVLITGTGAAFPAGSAMCTVFWIWLVAPHSSFATSVTTKSPAAVNVFFGFGPVAVPWPRPKFHVYVSVAAFSSVELFASNWHTFSVQTGSGSTAVGGLFPAGMDTVTCRSDGVGVTRPCWS